MITYKKRNAVIFSFKLEMSCTNSGGGYSKCQQDLEENLLAYMRATMMVQSSKIVRVDSINY